MKTVLLFFRNPDAAVGNDYAAAVKLFLTAGFKIDTLEIISVNDDIGFKRSLSGFKETADNLIVLYGDDVSFDIKSIISEETDSPLAENENARGFAEAVAKAANREYKDEYALMPLDSTLIPNVKGVRQGFMSDDKEFSLIVLPDKSDEYGVMCEKYVIPYLEKKYSLNRKRLVLKYFGSRELLDKTLAEAREVTEIDFTYDVSASYGDYTVGLCFDNYSESDGGAAIRYIVSALKDDIYAEYDASLSERLFDLLKLRKLKLAVAESFTGGRITASVIKNQGASAVLTEGLVSYSDESKQRLLGVRRADLFKEGAVSSVVAYQMATGLLDTANCDVAIATTGLAGPDTDASGKPVGLCYIAVGMKDGVHTYRFNFKGDRETVTETAKNTALYLAIKKVKNHIF